MKLFAAETLQGGNTMKRGIDAANAYLKHSPRNTLPSIDTGEPLNASYGYIINRDRARQRAWSWVNRIDNLSLREILWKIHRTNLKLGNE